MKVEEDIRRLQAQVRLLEHRIEDFAKPGEATLATEMFITPWSKSSVGTPLAALAQTAPTPAVWPSANRAILVPFTIDERKTVQKMFWENGATVSGNVDIGIYTLDKGSGTTAVRVHTLGSTAQATINVIQAPTIAPILLAPGNYYMALACDNITATFNRSGTTYCKHLGVAQMAAAFPLPAVITLAVVTADYLPMMGLALRTVVV